MPKLPPLGSDLAKACEELPPAKSGQLPDLWINHNQVTELYAQCSERHRSTVKHIRNIEKITGQQ